jgi:hypothetical protein
MFYSILNMRYLPAPLIIIYTGVPIGFMFYVTLITATMPPFNTTVPFLVIINYPIIVIGWLTWFYASSIVFSGMLNNRLLIANIIYRTLAIVNFILFIVKVSIYTKETNNTNELSALLGVQMGAVVTFGLTGELYRYILMYAPQPPITMTQTIMSADPVPVAIPVGTPVGAPLVTPMRMGMPSWNYFRTIRFVRF